MIGVDINGEIGRLRTQVSTLEAGSISAPAITNVDGKVLTYDADHTLAAGAHANAPLQAMCMARVVTSSFTLVSGTAYWVYLGYYPEAVAVNFIKFLVASAGSGSQTAEVCLASGSSAPSAASVTLTKIAANGTLDSLTGTGLKGNTSSMAAAVPAGTHLYVGIRTAMATTQPSLNGLYRDYGHGYLLRTASAGALTGSGPWTGAVLSGSDITATVAVGPDLRVSAV